MSDQGRNGNVEGNFKIYCHISLYLQVQRFFLAWKTYFISLLKGLVNVIFITSKLDQNSEPKKDPVVFIHTSLFPDPKSCCSCFQNYTGDKEMLGKCEQVCPVLIALDDTFISSVF